MQNIQNKKINSLTGLRFIAAFMVFVCHAVPFTPGPWYLYPVGFSGVTLFFTLSGFVICYNYFDKFNLGFPGSILLFYRARFARIYPVYFLVLAIIIILNLPTNPDLVIAHLTVTQAWSLQKNVALGLNIVGWSVSVEIFFYLLFPVLFFLVFKHLKTIPKLLITGGFSYIFLVIFITMLSVSTDHAMPVENSAAYLTAYIFPLPHLIDFILGCIAARLYRLSSNVTVSKKELKIATGLFLASLITITVVIFQPFNNVLTLGNLNSLFFAIIILYLTKYETVINAALSSKVMVLLGDTSYSFYLIHFYFIDFARVYIDYNKPVGYLAVLAVLIATIACSVIIYLFIETPMKQLIMGKGKKKSRPRLKQDTHPVKNSIT